MDKEEATRSPDELFNMLGETDKARSIYEALTSMLNELKDHDVKVMFAVNVAKYTFLDKLKPDLTADEAVAIVQTQCEEFCKEIMALPGLYRERLEARTVGPLLVDLIIGSCDCEHCVAYRRGMRQEAAKNTH